MRVVLRCGCGKCIAIKTDRLDEKYVAYIEGIRRRFGVTTYEELATVYRCRKCRKKPVKNPVNDVISLVPLSEIKKLKITAKSADINLEKYENLYVGMEFEIDNGASRVPILDVANKYCVKIGKTNGKSFKQQEILLAQGGHIEIPVACDLYKESKIVTEVYDDGSVGIEVVTRPVHIRSLNLLKPVFEYCKSQGSMRSPRAGLHMTFLLDMHMELSTFDVEVVQNIIQMVRYYYSALIMMFSQSNRGCTYRVLPSLEFMQNPIRNNSHHYAVTVRTGNQRIWAVEIRIPDGTDDWDVVQSQVFFYSALIRHCAKMSKLGLLFIDQSVIDGMRRFQSSCSSSVSRDMMTEDIKVLMTDLMSRLSHEVLYLKRYDEVGVDNMLEVV